MTYDEIVALIFATCVDVHSQCLLAEGVKGAVTTDKSLQENGIVSVNTMLYTRGFGPTGPVVRDSWRISTIDISQMVDVGGKSNAEEYISEAYYERLDAMCDNLSKEYEKRRKASYGGK